MFSPFFFFENRPALMQTLFFILPEKIPFVKARSADFEKKRAPAREAGAVFCALPDDFRLQTPKSAGKSGCARGKIMRIFLYTAQKKW